MKKKDVQVGRTYVVKVSGVLRPVKLERESDFGGWDGRNTVTGRSVRIRSAANSSATRSAAGTVLMAAAISSAVKARVSAVRVRRSNRAVNAITA